MSVVVRGKEMGRAGEQPNASEYDYKRDSLFPQRRPFLSVRKSPCVSSWREIQARYTKLLFLLLYNSVLLLLVFVLLPFALLLLLLLFVLLPVALLLFLRYNLGGENKPFSRRFAFPSFPFSFVYCYLVFLGLLFLFSSYHCYAFPFISWFSKR